MNLAGITAAAALLAYCVHAASLPDHSSMIGVTNTTKTEYASFSSTKCGPAHGRCPSAIFPYCSGKNWCGNTAAHLRDGQAKFNYDSIRSTCRTSPNELLESARCGSAYGICPTTTFPYCSRHGRCGNTDDHLRWGQAEFNYDKKFICRHPPASLISFNSGKCGPGHGSCPTTTYPYCSRHGRCGNTKDFQVGGKTEYNYCIADDQNKFYSSYCLYTSPRPYGPASFSSAKCGPAHGSCPSAIFPYCSQYNRCGNTAAHLRDGQAEYNFCGPSLEVLPVNASSIPASTSIGFRTKTSTSNAPATLLPH
jgi:hypothetical protein